MTLHSPRFPQHRPLTRRWLVALLLAAALLTLGWIWQSSRPTTAQASPTYQGPPQPPSARNGQAIYQESCAPCHGPSGGGDGPSAAELPKGASVLADPALARQATPDEWFDVVKNGRMDQFMPPWKNRLTDEQIWDAVAYAFTLSTSENEILRGEVIWEQECAACHGDRGAGDGPQALADNLQIADMGDLALSAGQSLEDGYAVTAAGHEAMPAFQDKLSEAELWAVLNYARTFSYKPLVAPAVPAGPGRLSGTVTNGTPGGGSAAGLTIVLNTFDQFDPMRTKETQTDANGNFEFTGLPIDPRYVYLLTTEYQGSGFGSNIQGFAEGRTELAVPVTIYESSDQPGTIRADLAQWFLQPHQGGILVGELYRITHESDRVFLGGDQVAPGKRAVLSFNVPAEAMSLVLDGGEIGDRFIRTQEGVVDTLPLAPGGRQILMRYLLPYEGTKAELAHALPYPIAQLSVLVTEGPKVETNLEAQGVQTISEEQWNSFGADNWAAGEEISLRLSGLERANAADAGAPAAPGISAMVLSYNPGVLIGVIALAAVVAGAVLLAYLLRKPPAEPPAEAATAPAESAEERAARRQQLLESIAQLDDAFEAGEIDQERYDGLRSAQKRSLLLLTRQLAPQGDAAPDAAAAAAEQGAA